MPDKRTKNITYTNGNIARYFETHRNSWSGLYPSEKWVLEYIAGKEGKLGSVLDVGCAAGGLGLALSSRFKVESYTGVDINKQVIQVALNKSKKFSIPCSFERNDITECEWLGRRQFDIVASLSCADWNTDTGSIIDACWKSVKPKGYFVISLRLTPEKGINDIKRSYQEMTFDLDESDADETANYVVFNIKDSIKMFKSLQPSVDKLVSYGYWGKPSRTAVTPYEDLIFAVFAARKGVRKTTELKCEFQLPVKI